MSLDPTPAEQQALEETLRRDSARMSAREWLGTLSGSALFVAVEAALLLIAPPSHVAFVPVALCMAVLVLSARVRIDLPSGYTVPTQLAFVPLAFAAPVAVVPLLVAAALAVAPLSHVLRGQLAPARLALALPNAAFALGPAAVFAFAGVSPRGASVELLLGALAAQFIADFGISALRHMITEGASLTEQLSDWWVYVVDAGLSCVGLVVAESLHRNPGAVVSLVPLLLLLNILARERRRRLESMIELGNAYRGTALVLGDVVEADDGYTGEHCKSVVALALEVGDELGLEPDHRRNLEFGALLHDVGKIAIPKTIVNKPGKLDAQEWTTIKTHTVEGQKMLDRVGGFMRDVGLIVRSHHERWDGQGYPDGLVGEAIPFEARIIACCDSWNAMRTDRSYRKALTYEAAMAELAVCSGAQFDPVVVDALIRVVSREAPEPRTPGEAVALSSGTPAPAGSQSA